MIISNSVTQELIKINYDELLIFNYARAALKLFGFMEEIAAHGSSE